MPEHVRYLGEASPPRPQVFRGSGSGFGDFSRSPPRPAMARRVLRAIYRRFLQRRQLLPSTVAEAAHVWPRSRLSLMVAGHVPQGSARPSACWFLPSPCASRRRRGRRSFRRSSKTSWRRSSRWPSSSSSRWCSSSCSGWCTSCRRRSRTSATTRSSRPSARCACCRWCSAGCCGRSRGCGPIRSRSCTRWPTARTRSITRRVRATSDEAPHVARLRDRIARLEERASPADLQALRADVDALEAKFARDEVR